jgi:flagella basal body P-ring formation protein FlgA
MERKMNTDLEKEQTVQAVLFMCRLTFKSLSIGLIVTYAILLIFLSIQPSAAATLKAEATINDSVVKASDLFDDIPSKKDAIIGNAPEIGQTIILDSRTLQRISNVYDISWKSTSPADQIVIRRTSQIIPTTDIVAAIKKDLLAKGVSGNFGVTLNNVAPTITLPGNVPATAEVSQMLYTPGNDVFSAVIAAPSAANPVKSLTVSGLIEKMVSTPVLKSGIKNGDIIGSNDIVWIDIPSRNMVHDTIIDADHLIGKTPVRMVDANVPIRERDITAPQMVARGDDVLLQFSQNGLELTAKGRAMQNGAEGDVIRVVNLSGNQSLRAEVIGNKIVRVQ